MKTTFKGLAIAAGVSLTFGVQAAYIGIDTDSLDTSPVPSNNNYATDVPDSYYNVGDTVYESATINALKDGPFKLTFTYLFTEAGFTNEFYYGGNLLLSTATNSYGDSASVIYNGSADSPLDFFFRSIGWVNQRDVHNEDNDIESAPNFNTYWADTNTFIISLDDFGANVDGNHDDMVIKITASKVPEPGTLALLGLGLAGMGMGMRRRSKA